MGPFRALLDIVLHLDKHLEIITGQYGGWTYVILLAIVFCETGLVVTPFLPGDSLLFAAGAVSTLGTLDPIVLTLSLIAAAILGDTVNYQVGRFLGPRVLRSENSRFLSKKHLARTEEFFARHGGKTIVLARFAPIVRTFAPFVAGAGAMTYKKFLAYNVVGAVLWVGLFVAGGYFFGTIPVVKKNFTLVIMVIVALSLLPGVFEYLRARRSAGGAARAPQA